MGVQGLWELLSPVGRRVSVETLTGKRLAIDASIWIVQFMKAMRDEKGEMVRNAHLIGFFRRICKLLFLRTKPVFVFDGGTPSLKRRTVIARRRQRENAQAKIRKTAEKLLLNHLKAMRVKELADNLNNQRMENELKGETAQKDDLKEKSSVLENVEVMDNRLNRDDRKGKSVVVESEEDIERQKQKNDLKGKSVATEYIEVTDNSPQSSENVTLRYDQETLDAMLAASLAAEEDGIVTGNASTSVRDDIISEEEDDEDEEMMLPVMDGKVDPAILASLPPSMQLDLLVQMRERLMAENRQKYQKVKKAPAAFSELQIQSYLKTVAFRREINEVQKSAGGKDVGGVQTSRIASEANREYIFSSSFTGDKQTLASAGIEKNRDVELQTPAKGPARLDFINHVSSVARSSSETESGMGEHRSNLNDVETYVDERGQLRVSRVRAMGIRMTRDLQRNLDLMKEIEQEKEDDDSGNREAIFNKIVLGDPKTFCVNNHNLEALNEGNIVYSTFNDDLLSENPLVREKKTAMNISFFEDEIVSNNIDDEDDIFGQLVAGSSVALSPGKTDFSGKHQSDGESDCSWEEGTVDEKGVSSSNNIEVGSRISFGKENSTDENEVDWEEVVCDVNKAIIDNEAASFSSKFEEESQLSMEKENINNENEVAWEEVVCDVSKATSRGSLQEEADMAEAIKRSLKDFTSETVKQQLICDLTKEKLEVGSLNFLVENDDSPSQTPYMAVAGCKNLDNVVVNSNSQIIESPKRQVPSFAQMESGKDEKVKLMHKSSEQNLLPELAALSEMTRECDETPCSDFLAPVEPKDVHLFADQVLDSSSEGWKEIGLVGSNCSSEITSHVSAAVMGDTNMSVAHENDAVAASKCHSYEISETVNSLEEPLTKELASSAYIKQNLVAEKNLGYTVEELRHTEDNCPIENNMEVPIEVSEASLDEEMLHLRQERIDLADEQRKLERNAESVSSEMFAECQELLQMFGLPYIIAPMEAEAQCAYLELAKLVDGVVTDDSDVFLFGAQSVYKNIFDDRKYVETYFMKDIDSELGLTREQLIRMALLLGSDYTEGVSGIGIVNAIEVVNAFPEEDGLQKFREWLESPDPTIFGKLVTQTGHDSRKKGSNVSNSDADCSKTVDDDPAACGVVSEGHDNELSVDDIQKTKQIFMDKHRNVSKNWHIPSSFPSEAVVSAYVSPQVDKSRESFSWGKPDLHVLRKLCWEKFGWSNQRADDLLVPVLKEYNKHETQLRLEAFYTFNERFAKIRSQRIKKAVKGITRKKSSELMDILPNKNSKKMSRPAEPDIIQENLCVEDDSTAVNKSSIPVKSTSKQSRKRKTKTMHVSNEVGELSDQKEDRCSTKKGASGNVRGRGRGRGRSRAGGRGRGKTVPGCESTEIIFSDGSSSNNELESQDDIIERPYEVRKSTRPRKHINYMENDSETPGVSKPVDHSNTKGINEVMDPEIVCDEDSCRDVANEPSEQDVEPSLRDECHSDYLDMGGGFCLDEDKQENKVQLVSTFTRLSDHDKNHQSLGDGSSEDYLAMGGGFCVDESEPDTEPVQQCSSPRRDLNETTTARMESLITMESLDPPSCTSIEDPNSMVISQEDRLSKADSSTTKTTGLAAIPFLRRKRKKT
ncbi:Flap endonuclease [Thalictrum thalictroides]|uniref:Flap endonuclease n=1 Tax=Thalictrum thalictroides TaxID=46969 RepID=A0A7J6VEK0_THATH|nr:Flap endonuclease [Thalictrum thalictroides]